MELLAIEKTVVVMVNEPMLSHSMLLKFCSKDGHSLDQKPTRESSREGHHSCILFNLLVPGKNKKQINGSMPDGWFSTANGHSVYFCQIGHSWDLNFEPLPRDKRQFCARALPEMSEHTTLRAKEGNAIELTGNCDFLIKFPTGNKK